MFQSIIFHIFHETCQYITGQTKLKSGSLKTREKRSYNIFIRVYYMVSFLASFLLYPIYLENLIFTERQSIYIKNIPHYIMWGEVRPFDIRGAEHCGQVRLGNIFAQKKALHQKWHIAEMTVQRNRKIVVAPKRKEYWSFKKQMGVIIVIL